MVLGSVNAGGKGKEIPAIKELLGSLILQEGDVITIDAIGCQKEIIRDIRKSKADYFIALKRNQGVLFDEAENFFNQAFGNEESAECLFYKNDSNTHGRNETHEIWLTEELDWLGVKNDWKDLNQLILVKHTREEKGKISKENRYYIASGKNKINKIEELARHHWFIENKYHWHLDVTFREAQSLISAKSNRNLRIARNIALQMLKSKPVKGMSYIRQMKKCARSDQYLKDFLIVGNF